MSLPTVLEKICGRKFEEIAERQRDCPIEQLQELTQDLGAVRNFTGALQAKIAVAQPAVIAEVKKASPSKGCLLYTSPSPRDQRGARMPSSA